MNIDIVDVLTFIVGTAVVFWFLSKKDFDFNWVCAGCGWVLEVEWKFGTTIKYKPCSMCGAYGIIHVSELDRSKTGASASD